MNRLKRECEKVFGKIGGLAYDYHWWTLALILGVTALLFSQLPNLCMDTRNETFFRPDAKVLVDYNEFRDQYGKDEFVVIAIDNPNIFGFEFLGTLDKFHKELAAKLPYLDDITSLVNIRNSYGKDDELIVEDFLEQWPESKSDLDDLKQRAKENTLYKNFILSEDLKTTAIIIKPLACNPETSGTTQGEGSCEPMSNEQNRQLMAELGKIVAKYETNEFPIAVSGMPAVIDCLNVMVGKDLSIVVPMISVVVLLIMSMMFRRLSGVVYPLILFILSVLSVLAIMGFLGIPMTNITIIVPSFMLVVSISDAVHILALFYPEYQRSGDKRKSIVAAMEHSGLAVLMTTVTTAGGLISFAAAEVAPIADLGIVTSIGVFFALFYTVTCIPAFISLFPVKQKSIDKQKFEFEPLFKKITHIGCRHSYLVVMVFTVVLLVSVIGLTKLEFSHLALRWFPKDSQIRVDTEAIDKKLQGTVSLDVVIDSGQPDGIYDPEFIRSLEQAAKRYSKYDHDGLFVGKIIDITTVIKETNRALHNNDPAKYSLPDNRELIAQELFLFQLSGSDDLDELVDQQFSQTRVGFHLPYRDSVQFRNFITYMEADLKRTFPNAKITVSGVNALFVEMLNNVMTTMMRSYFIALILISLLMVFMLGSLKMGFFSMIPNLFPIIVVMGLMGWLNIALDFGTILIGSVSIGIIVDDTIHFLHNFNKYYHEKRVVKAATQKTLSTVGRAMVITSLVLTCGFLCDMFSELSLNKNSGILIASTVVIALITDFLLMPALLSILAKSRKKATDETEVFV